MSFSERFIKGVGKMPFTAKHGARWCYTEATRAALRGDERVRQHFVRRLGLIALSNDVMLGCGAGMSYFSAEYSLSHHNPVFIAEAAGVALYALGHGASGVAQHLMVRRHETQAATIAARRESEPPAPEAASATTAEESPVAQKRTAPAYVTNRPTSPTLTERLVTNSGTVAAFVPLAHMTINDVVLPFLQH